PRSIQNKVLMPISESACRAPPLNASSGECGVKTLIVQSPVKKDAPAGLGRRRGTLAGCCWSVGLDRRSHPTPVGLQRPYVDGFVTRGAYCALNPRKSLCRQAKIMGGLRVDVLRAHPL